MAQKFYKEAADQAFPQGCQCGNNGGGDCDWCRVYYGEPELVEFEGYFRSQEFVANALGLRKALRDLQ